MLFMSFHDFQLIKNHGFFTQFMVILWVTVSSGAGGCQILLISGGWGDPNFCEKQLAIEGWTVYDLLKFLMIGKIAKIDDLSWVFRLRS